MLYIDPNTWPSGVRRAKFTCLAPYKVYMLGPVYSHWHHMERRRAKGEGNNGLFFLLPFPLLINK